MSVSIVVQRFRKCRLLIDELKYVTVGGGGDDSGCGLLAYVSFASTATPSHVEQAARTLLNLPILTTGLWGDDGSCGGTDILRLARRRAAGEYDLQGKEGWEIHPISRTDRQGERTGTLRILLRVPWGHTAGSAMLGQITRASPVVHGKEGISSANQPK